MYPIFLNWPHAKYAGASGHMYTFSLQLQYIIIKYNKYGVPSMGDPQVTMVVSVLSHGHP